jgi:hypothetical protein
MTTPIDLEAVVPEQFPQLATLVWNRDPARPLPGREALSLYERNWRFVDRDQMTDDETLLIRALAERFGNGILLV